MGLEWPGPPGGASLAAPDKDSDNTRNRERNVGKRWGTYIAKGIAIALLYGIAYLALRYVSFNQWFLPAGLRAACLLFLPYRYWPFVILGEVTTTLSQKIEMLDYYGWRWTFGSSIMLAPLTALVPLWLRKKLPSFKVMMRWLPVVTLALALWTSIVKSILNHALSGPKQPENLKAFMGFVIGDYMGILTALILVFLWRNPWKGHRFSLSFFRDGLISAALIGASYVVIEYAVMSDDLLRLTLLMTMTIPAVLLTFLHGWKGAAVGSLLASLGVAQAMTYTGIQNTQNDLVLYAQGGLILSSAVLLLLGGQITRHYDNALASGFAQQEALSLARMSLLSNEPSVRDQLIMLASMQVLMDDERDQLAKDLRANGKAHAAMELHRRGVEHRQLFQLQALVVYPIGIERDGLFGLLDTEMFRESRASGAVVDMRFGRTDPRTLSEVLQVSAYRCLCHAIDHLSDWEPTHYRLHLRVWHGHLKRGIYISAHITTAHARHITPHGESAWLLLEARVKAHGGLLRRGPDGMRLLLAESADEPSAEQEASFAA